MAATAAMWCPSRSSRALHGACGTDDLEDRVGHEGGVCLFDGVASAHHHLFGLRADEEPAALVLHVGTHPAALRGELGACDLLGRVLVADHGDGDVADSLARG